MLSKVTYCTNTKPHHLYWSDWKMGTAISWWLVLSTTNIVSLHAAAVLCKNCCYEVKMFSTIRAITTVTCCPMDDMPYWCFQAAKILLLSSWRDSTQPGQSAMWARSHQSKTIGFTALVYMCGPWSENFWHLAILKNWLFLWSVICCLKAWHCILGLALEWKTSPNWYIILVCSPTIPASITHHPSPQRKKYDLPLMCPNISCKISPSLPLIQVLNEMFTYDQTTWNTTDFPFT